MLKTKSTAERFRGYDRGPPLRCKEYLYGWFPPVINVYQRFLEKQTSYELQCLYNHGNSRYIDHHKGKSTPVAPKHIQPSTPTKTENLSTKTCYDSESSRRLVESVNDLIKRVEHKSSNNFESRPQSRLSISESVSTSFNLNSNKSIQTRGRSRLSLSRPKTALSVVSGSHVSGTSKLRLRPKSVPATAMSTSRSVISESKSVRSMASQKSKRSICRYPHKTWSTDGYETEVQIVMSPPMSPKTIENSNDKVNDYLSKISDQLETEPDLKENHNQSKNTPVSKVAKPVQTGSVKLVSKTSKQDHTGSSSRSASVIDKPNSNKETNVEKNQANFEHTKNSKNPGPKLESNSLKSPSMSSLNNFKAVPKYDSKVPDNSKPAAKSNASNLKSPSSSSLNSASMTLLMMSPIPIDDFSVFSSSKKSNTPIARSLLVEKPAKDDFGQIRRQSFKPEVSKYTAYKPMYNDRLQDLQWKMAKK